MEINEVPSEDNLLRLRLTVKTLLQTTFKQRFRADSVAADKRDLHALINFKYEGPFAGLLS